MTQSSPNYIMLTFGLTTIATMFLFFWTVRKSRSELTRKKGPILILALTGWLLLQAIFTLKEFYTSELMSFPPKIMALGILPPILTITLLFTSSKGRSFIDSLPLKNLTYLHTVRIPVEIVLYWLFLTGMVPELMTFEGRNFDILAGITAPFMAYFVFEKKKLSRQILLVWNFICLGLLANIVINALLSAPFPFQQFAFEQPNIAILNLPFSWLPTFIVPMVLFGHLVSIRQLIKNGLNENLQKVI